MRDQFGPKINRREIDLHLF